MGSEESSKGIDPSVGGLLWVRRPNGSWWPGRIMGVDELSEGCSVSARSGTPVKLLGKEDANIDWYNLEKSKRVQAFRCGEFDECIEKAKASAANPNKKAVKYARREDAILHALEIENAGKLDERYRSRKDDSSARKLDHEDMVGNLYNTQELSQSGLSFEDPNLISTTKGYFVSKKRRKTPNDSEDDGIERIKRMKGLQDLGIRADLKRKADKSLIMERSNELVQRDCASLSEFDKDNMLSNGNPLASRKVSSLSLKRRGSRGSNFHESMKRKDRRRPLAKVLESTAMVSVPILSDQCVSPSPSSPQGVTENKVSTLDSSESKKANGSPVFSITSDCTRVSCEKEISPSGSVHTTDAGVVAVCIHSEGKENGLTSMSEFPENDCTDNLYDVPFVRDGEYTKGFSKSRSVSLSKEGLDESGPTGFTINGDIVGQRAEQDTSKWQLKGKRNSRSLSNRISKRMDSRRSKDREEYSIVYLEGEHYLDKLPVGNTFDESLVSDNCNQVAESRMSEDMGEGSQHLTNQVLTSSIPFPSRRLHPCCQSRFTSYSRYDAGDAPSRNFCGGSSLFDVNLEVGASFPGKHVPLVSLMSKLNGKAIVGHPLTVQVLEEGYCDQDMGNIKHTMYLTTRSLLLDSCANAVQPKHAAAQSTLSPRKSPKKKKKGLTSKKIRRLSSLTTTHKQKEEKRKPLVEKCRGPVTCVPLNVVFSRMNQALNRSSRSTCHIQHQARDNLES